MPYLPDLFPINHGFRHNIRRLIEPCVAFSVLGVPQFATYPIAGKQLGY